jgi:N-acyl-L-homoserine lactone synthetase
MDLLKDGSMAFCSPYIWKSIQLGPDPDHASPLASQSIANANYEPLADMIEFGLSGGLTEIVAATDVLEAFDRSCAEAGYLEVSADGHSRIRSEDRLKDLALWSPAIPLAT